MSFCADPSLLDLPCGTRIHFREGIATLAAPLSSVPTSQARMYRTTDPRWLLRVVPAASAAGEARALGLMRRAGALGVGVPLVLATQVTRSHAFELMEHIPGPTYLQWAAAQPSIREKVRPLLELARSMARLHRHGVVHCDVKAEHLVMRGQHIVLLDWGVATNRRGALVGCTRAWAPQRVIRTRKARALLDCVGLSLIGTLALMNLTDPRDVRKARESALFRERFRPCVTATRLTAFLETLAAEDVRAGTWAPAPRPSKPPSNPLLLARWVTAAISAGLLWSIFR